MAPLVFAGVATLDTIALVSALPGPDQRVLADSVIQAGGGPAATAAVAAARLGLPAAFIGAVGDDEAGGRILAGLRAENVDVGAVEVVPGRQSAASVVLVESSSHTRAICTHPGPAPVISEERARMLREAEWVHVDHLGWQPAWRIISALPRRDRPRVCVDGGNDIDGLELCGVDLFVPTVAALTRRYGDHEVGDLLDAGLAEGAGQVVATREALAAWPLRRTARGRRRPGTRWTRS